MADEEIVGGALRRAAEAQMRRRLPDALGAAGGDADAAAPAAKRPRAEGGARYEYGSVADLEAGSTGIQGFLITNEIRREMSALKEIRPLLLEQLGLAPAAGAPEAAPAAEGAGARADGAAAPPPTLVSVRVDGRGFSLLRLTGGDAAGAEERGRRVGAALLALLARADAQTLPALRWAQRALPIAATCALDADALRAAGAALARLAAPALRAAPKPTFGVAFKNRADGSAGGGAAAAGPDRGAVIRAVAAGFEAALKADHGLAVTVDLKAPAVLVQVEALLAGGRRYAALAALPAAACASGRVRALVEPPQPKQRLAKPRRGRDEPAPPAPPAQAPADKAEISAN